MTFLAIFIVFDVPDFSAPNTSLVGKTYFICVTNKELISHQEFLVPYALDTILIMSIIFPMDQIKSVLCGKCWVMSCCGTCVHVCLDQMIEESKCSVILW